MMYLLVYLLIINLVSSIIMYRDKQKAIKQEWRTPESTLWFIAVVGGALGIWISMRKFRHKTKHISFTLGIPFMIILQVVLLFYILQRMS